MRQVRRVPSGRPTFVHQHLAGRGAVVEVDYGESDDRNFTVRDAEGNLWCFGTYAGEG